MRKRLTEKLTHAKKGSLGYTLTEMLIVIAIIAILCAIAIPSIIAISRSLRYAKANNYAKSIFLAAQQNLTEMRSDGGLGPVQNAQGAYSIPDEVTTFPYEFRGEYVYTVTGTQAMDRVLPPGSIDADIRDDQIVIEYNPITGNVYSVYYYDKALSSGFNLSEEYDKGALPRDQESLEDLIVGYYDGSGLNSSQIELEQTQAFVEFINGEEGIVRVLVPMPESFFGEFSDFASALNVTLTISGEWSMTQPLPEGATAPQPLTIDLKTSGSVDGCKLDVDGRTVIMEYCLDSLTNYRSFANLASGTQSSAPGVVTGGSSLTTLADESKFKYNVLPGENITIQATVTYTGSGAEMVKIAPGILSGVNPMFDYLQPSGQGGYVLAISNGRNMQNLNAIAPSIAETIDLVVFTSDIYWNNTVSYYNNIYGTNQDGTKVYTNAADEAPARALPYFAPIHNEALFGTAKFAYNVSSWLDNLPDGPIKTILGLIFKPNTRVPTLTDEFDAGGHASISGSDLVNNDGAQIYYLNIDSTKNPVGKAYYAGTADANTDRFTGLFSYVNTTIDNIHIVNPVIKGYYFSGTNNPATGALVGCAGYNTYISNCSAYLDTKDPNYSYAMMRGQKDYSKTDDQDWYGVSGEGAVGGLVGYAKSHRTTKGVLTANKNVLAFYNSFAAVNVSGNLREETSVRRDGIRYYGYADKDYGYSNGIGGLVGNSELTNFYNCYASGNVRATNTNAADSFETKTGDFWNGIMQLFGVQLEFQYNGRESSGAGGFVGTSHGTRYTNCFATGKVTSTGSSTGLGAGGFVGVMCIDETFAYGNQDDTAVKETQIAQRTVFTNCYSAGLVQVNGTDAESFSGANARVAYDFEEFATLQVADYYRLLGQRYNKGAGTVPNYEDYYVFKDSYYLSQYYLNKAPNSNNCASPTVYSTLQDLVGSHQNATWIAGQIKTIREIELFDLFNLGWITRTYGEAYFDDNGVVEAAYVKAYKDGYTSNWAFPSAATTHGYDLAGTYPFTKIEGLDYYGDWPSKPLAMGIAYYEAYEKDANGNYTRLYHFDRESTSKLKHTDNDIVIKDGYAILSSTNSSMVITVNGVGKTFDAKKPDDSYTADTKAYHVYWLTDAQMKAARDYVKKTGEFYVPITITQDGTTHTFYFNPNVALSHVNPAEGKANAVKPEAAPATIYIRSARQFAALGEMTNILTADRKFVQQMNLDAKRYLWESNTDSKVISIGTVDNPFQSSYSGLYVDAATNVEKKHTISGFESSDVGFFGIIGQSGSVSDLVINCVNYTAGSAEAQNAAVLVAVNNGTIDNVDMNITGNVTLTAQENAGLLAGQSTGTVQDCEVTTAEGNTISITARNAGGLIGSAEGTADVNTIVNDSTLTLNGTLAITSGTGNAGGLIGNISNLTADNLKVKVNALTSDALYTGGLAGYVQNATFTGVTTGAGGLNPVEVSSGSILSTNEKGYVAGVIGGAKDTVLTAMDVSAAEIEGYVAAGFLGTGNNTDATNCDATITGCIRGNSVAAGVAGIIGPQSVFNDVPVVLSGATITGADAAGYAAEIQGEAFVMEGCHVKLGTVNTATGRTNIHTTDPAAGSAAGFVITNSGSVGTSGVTGYGSIQGGQAAGFVVTNNSNISLCHVSPALTANDAGYNGNANRNLTVTGNTAAAGFVLTVNENATIANSYTLCAVTSSGTVMVESEGTGNSESGTTPTASTEAAPAATEAVSTAYGFAGTNKGTLNRCTANVDLIGGFAFVGTNEKLVTTSYGWYGDHDEENPTTTKAIILGGGNCFNSYFGDLAPVNHSDASVILYNADGIAAAITPNTLQSTVIPGFSTGYQEYPYDVSIEPPYYLYPMLRDHYGDWITPPQYAYGVAYYELYEDGTYKLHMVDLSDSGRTEEGNVAFIQDEFNDEGKIVQTGYALFYNSLVVQPDATILFSRPYGDFTYDFYAIDTVGIHEVAATIGNSSYAQVDTRFAKAIKKNGEFGSNETYEIRTPQQLANIGWKDENNVQIAANYIQTHSITTASVTSAVIGAGYTYNGNDLTLTIRDQNNTWLTQVGGSVVDLNLVLEGAAVQPVFGTVSGSVSLNSVRIGSIAAGGALVQNVSGIGNIATGAITTGQIAQNGTLFGSIQATSQDSAGTNVTYSVTVDSITTESNAVNGSIFASVAGPVKVTNCISVGAVNGKIFGDVSSTVMTGAITTAQIGTANKTDAGIFGDITGGSVNVESISSNNNAVFGQIFGNVEAPVNVDGGITVANVNGQIFGDISANVQLGAVSVAKIGSEAQVFGAISQPATLIKVASITTNDNDVDGAVFTSVAAPVNVDGGITVANVNGQIFGDISANVQLGAVSVAKIGSEAQVFGAINQPATLIKVASITTNGKDVDGAVFTSVAAPVTVDGDITVGNVHGTVFGTVSGGQVNTGTITTGQIATADKNASVFTAVKGGSVTVAKITTANKSVYGQVFGDVGSNVTVTNGITVGDVHGTVFGTVSGGQVNTGTITTGQIGTADKNASVFTAVKGGSATVAKIITANKSVYGQVFGNVGSNVTVTNGITVGDVHGTVFGTVSSGVVKTGTITTGQIGTADKNASVFTAVEGGSVTVAAITTQTKAVFGQVFGTVKAGVTVNGSISVGAVEGNIFGDIGTANTTNNFTVSVKEITTNENALTGQVFGNVYANITISDKMSIGALNGQVFGTVSNVAALTVANGITVADASACGDYWLIDSITNSTVDLGDIQVGNNVEKETVVTEEKDAEGNVIKRTTVETHSYPSVPAMIGKISKISGDNSKLIIGNIDSGNVSGDSGNVSGVSGWLIASVVNSEVILGNVTVHTSQTVVTITEVAAADGSGMTESRKDAPATYAPVSTMIGAINGGKVSSQTEFSTINLEGANIIGNLFASVTGATLENFHVETSGSLSNSLIGSVSGTDSATASIGNMWISAAGASNFSDSGLLVNALGNYTTVSGCKVVSGAVNVTAQNFGGITGQVPKNATLSNNIVDVVLNVNGNANTVIGGLAGINNGTVNVSEQSKVIVNYTQAGKVSATIGGLIGQMEAGQVSGDSSKVSVIGEINLLNGKGTGYNYIIGGAIGKDCGAAYSNVSSTVLIDSDWANAVLIGTINQYLDETKAEAEKAVCPAGFGPVGKFVGYVSNGSSFKNCSAVGSKTTEAFQFLGQIASSETTSTQKYIVKSASLNLSSFTEECADTTYTPSETATWTDWYTGSYADAGTKYRVFDVVLENCTFDLANVGTVKQTVDDSNYDFFKHNGQDDEVLYVHTIGDKVNTLKANGTSVSVSSIYSATGAGNTVQRSDYFQHTDGKYYLATATAANSTSWYGESGRTVTLSNGDVKISASAERNLFGWTWTPSSWTLYTMTEVVTSGTPYVLANADGTQMYIVKDGICAPIATTTFRINASDASNGALWTYANGTFTLMNSTVSQSATNDLAAGIHDDNILTYKIGDAEYYIYTYAEASHGYRATFVPAEESNKVCSYTK